MEKYKIAVYGTLKEKGRLSPVYLAGHTPIAKGRVYGYSLYDSGYGYPWAVENYEHPESYIECEVFEVTKAVLNIISNMEHAAGYTTESVILESGLDARMYVYSQSVPSDSYIGSKWEV